MIEKLNRKLEKQIPYLTPLCVLSGITFLSFLEAWAFLVPWIFACITFSSSLGLKVKDIGKALRNPLPIFVCLIILQVIMPLLAFGVGKLFFADNIYIVTGLVLAFIIPTGIVSLMWVSIHNGNTANTLSIILVNTLLSPFLVPLTLKVLLGADVSLDTVGLMNGLFWMIVIPSLLGILFSHFYSKPSVAVKAKLAPFSKIGLLVVIVFNSSVISPYFTRVDLQLVILLVILVALVITGYAIGIFSAKLFKWDYGIAISLAYNSGIRNNGVGAALAITYFPPQVTLPIIVVILFQQVLAATIGKFLKKPEEEQEKLLKASNI
ncbi:bile acid:sodium symporter family protein [Anaerobacillus alkaliphilus]|uniref:Bile acid:sodium symporter family protein n=1 Tax=Anaerobacillus alkaliphilus TaxID=1548597 RepID=A0A4Q0VVF2_9BACI|nr:bile acid:sodium symporter family protein [Anaerobacillus alkaliphilus]RXJ02526.1 bile acid:sodium symporter family protein [Anaerobacillus alkaliphilus]